LPPFGHIVAKIKCQAAFKEAVMNYGIELLILSTPLTLEGRLYAAMHRFLVAYWGDWRIVEAVVVCIAVVVLARYLAEAIRREGDITPKYRGAA
jgi:hypothetical protein